MKLVCMGDSLTEGYQMDLSRRWTDVLKENLNIEIINSGISGDTTGGMLARFKAMVIDHDPSHVIIMGGTNDMLAGVTVEIVKSNILAMSRYARYHGIQAIVAIPTPYCTDRLSLVEQTASELELAKRIDHMRQELKAYFSEDGLPIIEIGEGLVAEDYLADALHPNEVGHSKMMVNVKKVMEGLNHENITHR